MSTLSRLAAALAAAAESMSKLVECLETALPSNVEAVTAVEGDDAPRPARTANPRRRAVATAQPIERIPRSSKSDVVVSEMMEKLLAAAPRQGDRIFVAELFSKPSDRKSARAQAMASGLFTLTSERVEGQRGLPRTVLIRSSPSDTVSPLKARRKGAAGE